MPISQFHRALRERIGHDLLLVPGVAAVIHDAEGRVLVQERTEGGFSLPAGAIEPGETPAQAVVREVLEETGFQVQPTRVLGVFGGEKYRTTYPNGDQAEYTVILFACAVVSEGAGGSDGETKSIGFHSPSNMPQLLTEYPRHLLVRGCTDIYIE
jgi:8-oxo-dGTP pyrophosphatase MutT (NUDIX family)